MVHSAVSMKRPIKEDRPNAKTTKKAKLQVQSRSVRPAQGSQVLVMGQGDVGQLGLGPDILERARPTMVPGLTDIVDVCAGGMHTVCLRSNGEVITFGCNDEGALGRATVEEGSESIPGRVQLENKAVQISAGDSHTAALLEDGRVFAWGSFRDSHGSMGFCSSPEVTLPLPVQISVKNKAVKIGSGTDHLIVLTDKGELYTCGCAEQGQLGRVSERMADRHSRLGINHLLTPSLVSNKHFDSVWAGAHCTFARERGRNDIFVFGLNNYYQLGLNSIESHFHPSISSSFGEHTWDKICGGQHHTLALDSQGSVYSLGRKDYGRLGLGDNCTDAVDRPTIIPSLMNKRCIDISCGSIVSFAVTEEGALLAWGMGTNGQLGLGNDDDQYEPVQVTGKQLEERVVVAVSGGGQHTVLLAKSKQN